MGRRLQILLACIAVIFVPQTVFALGLGKIELKSKLNQPLEAEIELLQVRDLSEAEILVGLASKEDFDRVGVDKPFFLSDLKFKVDLNSSRGPIVRVTSRKFVREPFLNFIVQVQWPSGRLLREYTLLMDLPVFTDSKAEPVTSVPATRATERPTQTRPTQHPAQTQQTYNPRSSFDGGRQSGGTSQRTSSGPSYEGDTYEVQSNDTLWEIAAQTRPDRSVSVQQTMLAIQRINPEAFINDNINLLRKGQILRIPDKDGIEEVSGREAVREVANQNSAWSGDPNGSASGVQLEGRRNYTSTPSTPSVGEGRLTLSSPEEVSDSFEGRGSGSSPSSTDALENELAITLEQLDKVNRENADLKSKMESLEEQIATMERMIEVSNEDLRALELSSRKNQEQLAEQEESDRSSDPLNMGLDEGTLDDIVSEEDDQTLAETDLTAADDDYSQSIEDETAQNESTLDEAEVEPLADPEPVKKKVDSSRVVRQAPQEKGIVDVLMDNLLLVIGGVVGLVALIGGGIWYMRQRSSEEEMDELEDDFLSAEPLFEESDPLVEGDLSSELPDEEPLSEEEVTEEEIVEEEGQSESEPETEDIVAEADIYIAYGKYEQAEEMLVKGLNKEPANAEMRVKLLEVYANQQDVESFDPHYAKLLVLNEADAAERAAQLRSAIAGAGEFDASVHDTSDIDSDAPVQAAEDLSEDDVAEELTLDSEGEDDSFELDLSGIDDSLNIEDDSGDDEFELNLDFATDDSESNKGDDLVEQEKPSEDAQSDVMDVDLSDIEIDASDDTLESEALDLDLDLAGLESDDTDAEAIDLEGSADLSVDSDEIKDDLSLDFSLDTELDAELDSTNDSGLQLEGAEDLDSESSSDLDEGLDFDLGELDLDLDDDVSESEEAQKPSDATDDGFSLDGDDETVEDALSSLSDEFNLSDDSVDQEVVQEEDTNSTLEFDLSELESLDTNLGGDNDEPANDDVDLELDLGKLDGDESLEAELDELDVSDNAVDEEDELDLDLDLDLSADLSSSDADDDLNIDLDLDADLDADLGSLDSSTDEVNLDAELDLSLDGESGESGDSAESGDSSDSDSVPELDLGDVTDVEEPLTDLDDVLEPESSDSLDTGSEDETLVNAPEFVDTATEADDLNIEADMDLSALDEELDELTADLDGDLGDLGLNEDLEEVDAALGDVSDAEPAVLDSVAENAPLDEPVSLEEPVTDFDLDDVSLDDVSVDDVSLDEGLELGVENESIEEPVTDFDGLDADLSMEEPVTDLGDLDADLSLDEPATELEGLDADLSLEEPLTDLDALDEGLSLEEPETSLDDIPSLDEASTVSDASSADDSLDTFEAEDLPQEALSQEAFSETFSETLSSEELEFEIPEVDPEATNDDDLGFLSDSDEVATKLDLARAYIDMDDAEGAKDIIQEIMKEGNDIQKKEAESLLSRISQ